MTKKEYIKRLLKMQAEAEKNRKLAIETGNSCGVGQWIDGAQFYNGLCRGITNAILLAEELKDDDEERANRAPASITS